MIKRPWRLGAGALVAVAALLAACDGENLFDVDQNPFIEPRVSVSAPDGAFAGDTIGIAVSASAAQNIASITVSVRGAATKDTTITISPPARSVTSIVKVALPLILTDTLIYVQALATDVAGNVSKVRGDTAVVIGPPAIIEIDGPDSLVAGTTTTFSVRAFGSRRISQIDVALRGAVNTDNTITVNPPANDVRQNFTITLPAVVSDTTVRVLLKVRDITGLSSGTVFIDVPIRVSGPIVTVTPPLTVNPGGQLGFTVNASSIRGIASIRVEFIRGNPPLSTITIPITPPQNNVTQPVSIPIPGDFTGDTISFRVIAIDRAGVPSAPTAVFNVRVNNGVPTITSVQAPDSTRGGQTIDVRVTAVGVRPLSEIVVRFRGAVNTEERIAITSTNLTQTKIVSVAIPVEVSDTLLFITVTAEDVSGALSENTASSRKTVRVADVSAPVVTAVVTPGQVNAGGRVNIRVNARDNVALRQIGYAVVNPAGDTIGILPTLTTTSGITKDTVFSFTVPSTLTPRTLRVIGVGVDASGRRGNSTPVNLIISDSSAPGIQFNAPTPGSTLPLNDSVRVSIRVTDPTGIKSISLHGESTRVDSLGPTRVIQRFGQKTITLPAVPGQRLPTDTTIVRYLNAIPDSVSETVSIIVTAIDSLGNSAAASVSILVGGPRVELRNPLNNAQVVPGGTLLLSAFAVDRTTGIDSVRISITGAQTATFMYRAGCPPTICLTTSGSPSVLTNDSVVVSDNYVVGAPTGQLSITATAWNRNRVAGTSNPVAVTVTTTAVADTARPQVRLTMTSNDRVELSDTITVDVAAQDVGSNGIRRIGLVVIATPGGTGAPIDTLYLDTVFTGTGRTGLQPKVFKFTLDDFGYSELNLVTLPRNITFTVHAFAVDTGGNCGANVTSTLARINCDTIVLAAPPATSSSTETRYFVAASTPGFNRLVTVVPGFSRALQAGSIIADILVDNTVSRPRLFLSNHNNNRVDVIELADSTFNQFPISVGSEPWGLFLNNAAVGVGNPAVVAAPRLMVANSGGTNISFVDITALPAAPGAPDARLAEVPTERLLTPNEVLYNIAISSSNGLRYTTEILDFSDRPQFVGQDANGTVLYSTKPTGSAPDGSVRYLTNQPVVPDVSRPDSKILYNRDAINPTATGVAVAYVDSVVVTRPGVGNDAIELFDHIPGNPAPGGRIRSGRFENIDSAVVALAALGSDVQATAGAWVRSAVGLSDTTYMAVSGNREFLGFGEGGVAPFARIWLWRCGPSSAFCLNGPVGVTSGSISDNITVADLVGNAAETVVGLSLNNDGELGAARGALAAYYFSNNTQLEGDLRLQGQFSSGVAGGGGGVALHPSHNDESTCGETTMSFIATATRSIKIVDTFHYRLRGEILIRDNIVGPLRAALPIGGDAVVPPSGAQDQIILKLYGVTSQGRAVIINVRRRDLTGVVAGVCQ